jgi:hypothetical protein
LAAIESTFAATQRPSQTARTGPRSGCSPCCIAVDMIAADCRPMMSTPRSAIWPMRSHHPTMRMKAGSRVLRADRVATSTRTESFACSERAQSFGCRFCEIP